MSWLLPVSALFPLALIGLAVIPFVRRRLVFLLPFAALPALAAAVWVPDGAEALFPRVLMGAAWRMDPLGRVFLLFTAFCWAVAGLSAVSRFRDHPRRGSFAVPFLLAMAGNLALPAAADAVTFYTGFTLMGFAAWALVVHGGTPEALRAGRVYLFIVLLGELMVLPGLVKGALRAESPMLDAIRAHWIHDPEPHLALGLIAVGFALKAGLFPLHFWLPLAHPAAPAPASAVLSGCMIKTGLLAWLRLLPLGELALPELGGALAVLAAVGLVGGMATALFQDGAKALLAYSSLSKMGMMLLFVSLALIEPTLAPAAIAAAVMLAAVHALHKCALFLGAGLTPSLGAGGRVLLCLLTLSFAGAPVLSGMLMKSAAKPLLTHPDLPAGGLITLVLLAAAALGTPALIRFARLTWPLARRATERRPAEEAAWALAAVAALTAPWLMAGWLSKGWPGFSMTSAAQIQFDPGFWIGAGLAALAILCKFQSRFRIPPGDLLNLPPPPSPGLRNKTFSLLHTIETQLNQAPGGLVYLLILLALLGLLGSELL